MASQSLYRKWRSQTFADLIGQEATTRTLLNAVRDGRLAHAYLFCGPRGTGKTSAARLLAKAINCANPKDGEPCNECVSCLEITAGRSPDVIEIDAASNTGVDNIRDLRQNVNLLGSGGRYKVYVIDEVHMLSTSAFNALLKTLEEPPPRVVFVLATTEAQKVLATVVSRCQRFDFRRFSMRDLVARLRHVAAGEGLELEPAAADLLARAAQGGMRDALSLLDQAMAYCGARIDLDRTRTMLGLADPGALRGIVAAVAEDRAADALHALNEMVANGADLRQLQQQMGEEWRALLLARAGADVATVMDRTADEAKELAALAARFSLDELMGCARVFARTETPARGLPVPQLALELGILECLAIKRGGGAITAPQPSATASRPTPDAPPASASRPPAAPQPPQPARPQPAPPPAAAQPSARPAAPQVDELDLDEVEREMEELLASPDGRHPPQPSPQPMPVPDAPAPAPAPARPGDAAMDAWGGEPAGAAPQAAPVTPPAGPDHLAEARRQWDLIKKICRQKSPSTTALLHDATPVAVEAGDPPVLVLEAEHDFHHGKLKVPKTREIVEWAVEQALGAPLRVRAVLRGAHSTGMASGAAGAPGGQGAAVRPPAARAPSASPGGANGYNGHGGNGHAADGGHAALVREAPAAPRPDLAGRAPNGRPAPPGPRQSIEDEARADAVVREVQRALGAELLDVRPADDEAE